mmetsp:Transcript_28410/g.58130  ORF Transcript_28410/g.58130 Transcript_28410/m.58130 type:complete len:197 (+) Transcript_28410:602-1192(+)
MPRLDNARLTVVANCATPPSLETLSLDALLFKVAARSRVFPIPSLDTLLLVCARWRPVFSSVPSSASEEVRRVVEDLCSPPFLPPSPSVELDCFASASSECLCAPSVDFLRSGCVATSSRAVLAILNASGPCQTAQNLARPSRRVQARLTGAQNRGLFVQERVSATRPVTCHDELKHIMQGEVTKWVAAIPPGSGC